MFKKILTLTIVGFGLLSISPALAKGECTYYAETNNATITRCIDQDRVCYIARRNADIEISCMAITKKDR